MPSYRFSIVFAPAIREHLGAIERKDQRVIQVAIESQLAFEPDQATRNRKLLTRSGPFGATWELRCGVYNQFRVFYDVDRDNSEVNIVAIGVKQRNRLLIGGKEFKL